MQDEEKILEGENKSKFGHVKFEMSLGHQAASHLGLLTIVSIRLWSRLINYRGYFG